MLIGSCPWNTFIPRENGFFRKIRLRLGEPKTTQQKKSEPMVAGQILFGFPGKKCWFWRTTFFLKKENHLEGLGLKTKISGKCWSSSNLSKTNFSLKTLLVAQALKKPWFPKKNGFNKTTYFVLGKQENQLFFRPS